MQMEKKGILCPLLKGKKKIIIKINIKNPNLFLLTTDNDLLNKNFLFKFFETNLNLEILFR